MRAHLRAAFLAALAASAMGCDQIGKYAAVAELTDALERPPPAVGPAARAHRFWSEVHPRALRPHVLVPDHVELTYVENTGAAFSLMAGVPWARWLLIAVSLVGLAALSLLALRLRDPWSATGVALIVGGALGNLLDRARLGYVIDFVHLHLGELVDWPIFNIADVLIAAGAILLVLRLVRAEKKSDGSRDAAPVS